MYDTPKVKKMSYLWRVITFDGQKLYSRRQIEAVSLSKRIEYLGREIHTSNLSHCYHHTCFLDFAYSRDLPLPSFFWQELANFKFKMALQHAGKWWHCGALPVLNEGGKSRLTQHGFFPLVVVLVLVTDYNHAESSKIVELRVSFINFFWTLEDKVILTLLSRHSVWSRHHYSNLYFWNLICTYRWSQSIESAYVMTCSNTSLIYKHQLVELFCLSLNGARLDCM